MSAEAFNQTCRCVSVDVERLKRALERDATTADLFEKLRVSSPHLFSQVPVYVSRQHIAAMLDAMQTLDQVMRHDAFVAAALADAPALAAHDPKTEGVFMGFDFHLGADGPRLIEINTNAGGALLNLALGKAQRACCRELEPMVPPAGDASFDERVFLEAFLAEWSSAGRAGRPSRVAIIDLDPAAQFLYGEFLLFQSMFERSGIAAVICDPRDLTLRDGALWLGSERVDLVYNRTTDFYFETPASRALRDAFASDAAVITPHPRAHALWANKRHLVRLSDAAWLEAIGIPAPQRELLRRVVPKTTLVHTADADALWSRRKELFFKPEHGFGSKAAYRGDKLTRATFAELLTRPYVAQSLVPPSTRVVTTDGEERPLKVDLRAYAYRGVAQLFVARLYQGQTTNFRTQGGGFAPIFTDP